MKTRFFILFALATATVAMVNAQIVEREVISVREAKDTVIVTSGRHRVVVVEKSEDGTRTEISYNYGPRRNKNYSDKTIRSGGTMDLGFNVYDDRNIFTGEEGGGPFPGQNTSKSVGFAVYPWMGYLGINRSHSLELVSGIGLDWANYRFHNGWTIANINGHTEPSNKYILQDKNVKKSKLTTLYLNVPLMMRVNFPANGHDNRFYLAAGVIGGVKLGSHTKAKFYSDGKDKEHDSFNLNMFRYQLTARAGYSHIGVFFNYQMSQMFENGHGPELYPYTVGFTFGF